MNQIPSNEERIFQTARSIADVAAREAYIRAECGADAVLLDRIVALLKIDAEPTSYLESPPVELAETSNQSRLMEKPGDEIGPYKLLQQIGEGGFGVVYMAEQTRPIRRKVALKIIKPGMDTREVIARFEAERQALALMDHPNIAKVLDGGETRTGRPYFVMELVKGIPLTRFCDENRLDTRQRLGLFASVCKAIQHAHHKGVIHRDIKPSNVMITLHDSLPVPKVIDFGVSKAITQQLTEKTLFTAYGQMIGTPQYMSPEQAEMSGLDIDTRSDIYSLGVLLYELLTGSTPLDVKSLRGKAFAEMQRLIREAEPQKPSLRLSTQGDATVSIAASRNSDPQKLSALLRGELDWIVLKALDKDRNRRYETANDFAHDVERYLRNESVQACPPTFAYRVRKTVHRNRTAMLVGGTLLLTLIGGLATSLWQYSDAVSQRKHADTAKQEAIDSEKKSLDRLAQVQRAEKIKDEALAAQSTALIRSDALRLTAESSAILPTNPGLALLLAVEGAKRLPDLAPANNALIAAMLSCREVRTFLHDGVGTEVRAVEVSPDGSRVLGIEHTRILVWDTNSGELIAKIDPQGRLQNIRAKFSPDGLHFATYSYGYSTDTDKNGVKRGFTDRVVRIWDSSTGLETLVLRGHTDRVSDVCYSEDGMKLLTASWDGTARLWNTITGEELKSFNYGPSVNSVVFSPNEDRLLAIAEQQAISSNSAWDDENDHKPTIIDPPFSVSPFPEVSISVGSSSGGFGIPWNDIPIGKCWDLTSGEEVSAFKYGQNGDPVASAYLSDGKHALIKFSNVITIWEVETGQLAFDLETRHFKLGIWPVGDNFKAESEMHAEFEKHRKAYAEIMYEKACDTSGHVQAKKSLDGNMIRVLCGFDPEDRSISFDNLKNYSPPDKTAQRALPTRLPTTGWTFDLKGHTSTVTDVKVSGDGRWVFSAGDNSVRMWEVRRQLPYLDLKEPDDESVVVRKTNTVAFNPNGKQVATGSKDKSTRLWDATTGNQAGTLKPKIEWPEFNPGSKKSTIVDFLSNLGDFFDEPFDKHNNLFERQPDPKPIDSMFGEVRLVRFSPDGKRLVALSDDLHAILRLVDLPDSPTKPLPFTPARVWDTSTFELLCAFPGNEFDFSTSDSKESRLEFSSGFANVAFTPDSKYLVTSDGESNFSGVYDPNGTGSQSYSSGMRFEKNGKILGPFFGVKSWEANNGQLVKSVASDIAGQLCYISDDGLRGIIPMQSGRIVVDPIVGSTICKLKEDSSGSSYGAQFSEDLKWLLTMEYPASRLWDLETGNMICQIESKLSPPLERHARSDNDTNAKPQSNAIYPLLAKFGANSTRLITIYSDNSAHLREIPSGALIAALVGHTKNITCVDFSPDGKWVVTGSSDGTARVWSANNGREYVAFPHGEITAVAFAPDSQRVVTASADGTSRIWPLDLLELAKSKAPRQMTAAERVRFEIEPNDLEYSPVNDP